MLLVLVILVLLCGGFGGYYGQNRYGTWGGPGIGLGTVLLLIVIFYLIGFRF